MSVLTPFEQMTFAELAQHNQAMILMAIPVGGFNQAVFTAMDLTLRWKAAQPNPEQKKVRLRK